MSQLEGDLLLFVERTGDRALVRAAGDLSPASADRLVEAVAVSVEDGARRVDVDCSQMTLAGAAGIRALLEVHRTCVRAGVPLRLEVTPAARRLLDLVGLWWLGVVSGYEGGSLQETLRRYAELRYRGTLEGA